MIPTTEVAVERTVTVPRVRMRPPVGEVRVTVTLNSPDARACTGTYRLLVLLFKSTDSE